VNAQDVPHYRPFHHDLNALEGKRILSGSRSHGGRKRKNQEEHATLRCQIESVEQRKQLPAELEDVELLVRTHRASIFRYAMSRLRDRDLAENVTQDCLMRAFRARDDFRGSSTVRTWLFTIATNLIRDYTRTKRFRFWKEVEATAVTLSDIHDRLSCGTRSPEFHLLVKEQLLRMRSVIDSLPTRQREVVLLRYSEEMKLSEIARVTGMTLSAIKTHLYRGVRAIRVRLQEDSAPSAKPSQSKAIDHSSVKHTYIEERARACRS
jgi:RNA polymerase sigma-70 factor (ECF subfamily)